MTSIGCQRRTAPVTVVALLAAAVLALGPWRPALGGETTGASVNRSQVAVPTPPPEAEPVLAVLGPLAAPACSAAGLTGMLLALVAPGGTVPREAYEALMPVYTLCAGIPAPARPVTCDADDAVAEALRENAPEAGLLPLPAIQGAAVDSVTALEVLVLAETGAPLSPTLSPMLREVLGCEARVDVLPAPAPPPLVAGVTVTSGSPDSEGEGRLSETPSQALAARSTPATPLDQTGSVAGAPTRVDARGVPIFDVHDFGTRAVTAAVLFVLLAPFALHRGARRLQRQGARSA